jgi:Lrp/AsnC family leucine-responsive transcriptional regulator
LRFFFSHNSRLLSDFPRAAHYPVLVLLGHRGRLAFPSGSSGQAQPDQVESDRSVRTFQGAGTVAAAAIIVDRYQAIPHIVSRLDNNPDFSAEKYTAMGKYGNSQPSFDEIDYKIIKLLKKNARIKASEIARELHVKERTVRNRISRLIDLGIGHFSIYVDPLQFGYGIIVDVFLNIDPTHEKEIVRNLLAMRNVSYIAEGETSQMISIAARFKDVAQMNTFLRDTLPGIDGVTVSKYGFVTRLYREYHEWMPSMENFIT